MIVALSCAVDGCNRKAESKGLCPMHYARLKKNGDVNKVSYKRTGKSKKNPVEYGVWQTMCTRCRNRKRDKAKYYVDRGIKVCDRWLGPDGFDNFLKDMGERPEGHTLDRIDNNAGYCPENCRWASKEVQAINKAKIAHPYISVDGRLKKKYYVRIQHLGIEYKSFNTLDDARQYRDNVLEKHGRTDILEVIKTKEAHVVNSSCL